VGPPPLCRGSPPVRPFSAGSGGSVTAIGVLPLARHASPTGDWLAPWPDHIGPAGRACREGAMPAGLLAAPFRPGCYWICCTVSHLHLLGRSTPSSPGPLRAALPFCRSSGNGTDSRLRGGVHPKGLPGGISRPRRVCHQFKHWKNSTNPHTMGASGWAVSGDRPSCRARSWCAVSGWAKGRYRLRGHGDLEG